LTYKLFTLVFIALLQQFVASAIAGEKTVSLLIATMVCGPDPHNVKNALTGIGGVSDVSISLADKTATVTFDDQKVSIDGLLTTMAGAGYTGLVKDAVN
jgi:copper chaperone CopZ